MHLDNTYVRLPARFHSPAIPDPAEDPTMLAWNTELAEELGLAHLANDATRIFSGGPLPDEFEPIALAYAGHQFGTFVPQLGDGRAALLGEVVSRNGQRYDIQLKGSGRTRFSRGGDGRSWLGPVIREYVVSEAMHRLGVPTTRALAAVATGERVYREAPLPGAVFTRVASSHLRVGTFQYVAARGEAEAVKTLADYAIDRHYPDVKEESDPYVALFRAICRRQANLVARWMAVGFIHGVMNTDNVSIAGETIDYGPCAFMDEFRFAKVFSSIDHAGRYAYGNQPRIAHWNLARLAETLLAVCDQRGAFEAALDEFPQHYSDCWLGLMRAKLGMTSQREDDQELIGAWLRHLEEHELDYSLSFRELAQRLTADGAPRFGEFEAKWRDRVLDDGRDAAEITASMNAVNPLFIPRNHRIEQAIQQAVDGDTTMFRELNDVLRKPFEEQPEFAHYAEAPDLDERVARTFCGT